MGMGGKENTSIPDFVKNAAASLGEKSQQIWDLARPLNEQGTGQIAELIRTGGLNANVPIINNAVSAQRSAGRVAGTGLEGATTMIRRGNINAPYAQRERSKMRMQTRTAANRIPYLAAAPLIGASVSSAISGGRNAQTGMQGAAGALASGTRQDIISQNKSQAGSRAMMALLYGLGGGFGGSGMGGAKTQSPYPSMWQVGGPTTVGAGGGYASAPGIMLEF